ncbi:MAG: glycosyltransferase [Solirubrobacterales bacterium]|nr:glycosyltransferase [Solirubrobacterales bacterium]
MSAATPGIGEREGAARAERKTRVAVVGMSAGPICGARDHAILLAEAMGRAHVQSSLHWLLRTESPLRAARTEIRGWTRQLASELGDGQSDAVLFHYSVFAYAHRGIPVFVRPTLTALRSSGLPLITVLHEFAFPWRLDGLRGKIWAVTQRAALIEVMRASAAVVVTTDFRADWLASRRWLPKRPSVVAPVFSNLPAPAESPRAERHARRVGIFGYSYDRGTVGLVLDAIRLLREEGLDVELLLLGAPGPSSPAGELWAAQARSRAVEAASSFSGTLPAQDLSNALGSCDVLLFADRSGPTSRKTTLAASLASGRGVLAFDGPRRWADPVAADALRLVEPSANALADSMRMLLADEGLREALGVRGREFAEKQMSVDRSAEIVSALVDEVVG